jgi:hypothetical protein
MLDCSILQSSQASSSNNSSVVALWWLTCTNGPPFLKALAKLRAVVVIAGYSLFKLGKLGTHSYD